MGGPFRIDHAVIAANASSLSDETTLREALRKVIDPEAGMNIVDLGLIYGIAVTPEIVCVEMTMTSPACPLGDLIVKDVEDALRACVPPGTGIDVRLVWDPPWEPARMSDAARRHFGW